MGVLKIVENDHRSNKTYLNPRSSSKCADNESKCFLPTDTLAVFSCSLWKTRGRILDIKRLFRCHSLADISTWFQSQGWAAHSFQEYPAMSVTFFTSDHIKRRCASFFLFNPKWEKNSAISSFLLKTIGSAALGLLLPGLSIGAISSSFELVRAMQ